MCLAKCWGLRLQIPQSEASTSQYDQSELVSHVLTPYWHCIDTVLTVLTVQCCAGKREDCERSGEARERGHCPASYCPCALSSSQQCAAVCSMLQHAIGKWSKFSAQVGKESGDSGVLVPCRKLKWRWAGDMVIGHAAWTSRKALLCGRPQTSDNIIMVIS